MEEIKGIARVRFRPGKVDEWKRLSQHFSNISHLMEPILATASVTGEVLGTPNAKMKKLLGTGGPNLFTPWIALQDLPKPRRKAVPKSKRRPR